MIAVGQMPQPLPPGALVVPGAFAAPALIIRHAAHLRGFGFGIGVYGLAGEGHMCQGLGFGSQA